ncbi:MAG TPA: hypothetical protein VFM45_09385 [Anaeromyxobacteraceae bacterium]|nr:hypothetical protein [Anaeromyxobacteraceae bacterium]
MNRDIDVMVRAAHPTRAAPVIGLALLLASALARGEPLQPSPARTEPPECQPTQVAFPPDASGTPPAAVTVRFEVGPDGTAQDVSVGFPIDAAVSDLLVQSAVVAVQACRWVLPGGGSDEPGARKVALRLPVVRAATPPRRLTAPRMVRPDCFREAFDSTSITVIKELKVQVKFPVFVNGTTGRAHTLQRFDDPAVQERFEQLVTTAVAACEWTPGHDGDGRAVLVYVILPIKLR